MARKKARRRRSATSRSPHTFGDVMGRASAIMENRKQLAGERLTEIATATRRFTTSFEDLPYLRDYTGAAAQKIDEIAEYVARTDIPEMLGDVAALAKRQRVATFALSVAAGVVTTQLVRRWPTAQGGANSNIGKSRRRRLTGAKRQEV